VEYRPLDDPRPPEPRETPQEAREAERCARRRALVLRLVEIACELEEARQPEVWE